MMKVYKLTDEKFQTFNKTQWGEGVEHTTSGEGELCGSGWLHAYEDPRIAILMNPIHGDFNPFILWEADGDVGIRDGHLKLGCMRLKTIRQLKPSEVTLEQRVRFGIECAKQVYHNREWNKWADKWMLGEDKKEAVKKMIIAARAADAAADAAEERAVNAAITMTEAEIARAVAWPTKATALAAHAAARAARAADAAEEWAARAAEWATAWAADTAAEWSVEIAASAADTAAEWAAETAASAADAAQDIMLDIYAAMEKAGIV